MGETAIAANVTATMPKDRLDIDNTSIFVAQRAIVHAPLFYVEIARYNDNPYTARWFERRIP
jgi:hypothetical protein